MECKIFYFFNQLFAFFILDLENELKCIEEDLDKMPKSGEITADMCDTVGRSCSALLPSDDPCKFEF